MVHNASLILPYIVFLLEGLRLWSRCNDIILTSLGLMLFPRFAHSFQLFLRPRRQGQSYHGVYPQTATEERFIRLFRLSFCMVSKPHFTVCPSQSLFSLDSKRASLVLSWSCSKTTAQEAVQSFPLGFLGLSDTSFSDLSLPFPISLLLNRKDAGHTPLST
jgi:hypothetical protein